MNTLLLALMIASLEQLGWMAGHWTGNAEGVESEEHWTSPAGGIMVGMHRDAAPGKRAFFEFLRIEQRADDVVYVAMPRGRSETEFPLKELSRQRVVFENLRHDFPQRIIYWRESEMLCARVEGKTSGGERSEQWCWRGAGAR